MIIVPAEVAGIGSFGRLAGLDRESFSVESVVVTTVLEFFLDAAADLDASFGRDRDVAGIEQLVDV
jgi:hypothetical protein